MQRAAVYHALVGLAAAALGLAAGALPLGELLSLKGHDLFQSLRPTPPTPPEVVVVAVDEPSFAELGLQWPWPRSVHARLTETLTKAGASVIAFDIVFAEPSNAADDARFAEAIRKSGRVVLASAIEFVNDARVTGSIVVRPLTAFTGGAREGLATIPLDRDFVVRRIPPADPEHASFAGAVLATLGVQPTPPPEGALLAFTGPPGSVETVSYYQALDPAAHLPEDFFRDRVVLIGRSVSTSTDPARGQPDVFATPFLFGSGSALMSGVEIQANIVDAHLRGRTLARADGWVAVVVVAALGLLGSVLSAGWDPVRSGLLVGAAVVGFGGATFGLFIGGGWWVAPVPGVIALVAPYGCIGGHAYLTSERARRAIRRAFSHYVSPAILEEVLKDPARLALGGRTAEVTLLFSDIAGFTGISEKLPPEHVGRFLNRYFTEMTAIVFAHHGTVDKFVGDALVAFWGAPVADPRHALHACQAAVAMQARLATLRAEMVREGFPELHIRIGLNSGDAVVGNMGSTELFNYTALGDAVNLASRLEAANKELGTSILLSRAVLDRVGPAVQVEPRGSIQARGRSAAVEVFELRGVARDVS